MYVTEAMIRDVEAKYGQPIEIARAYELTPRSSPSSGSANGTGAATT